MRIEVKLARGIPVVLAVALAYGCASFPTMSVAPEARGSKTPSVIPESRGGGMPGTASQLIQIPGAPAPVSQAPVIPAASQDQIAALVSADPINATLPPQPLAQYLNTAFTEVLKVPYSLGPNIGSRNTIITMNAPPTISKRAYLSLLQNTLRGYGLTLSIRNNAVLITDDEAGGPGGGGLGPGGRPQIIRSRSSADTPQTGRVVQVFQLVALQASADLTALAQRIGGFPATSPAVQIDAAANALVVEGPARQVAAMVEILRTLDQPAYAGAQVVRLEPVYQSPIDFAANLQSALAAEGYIVSADPLGPKSIMILPLTSTNQTLVFAADKQTMARVQFWAREIDAPSAQGDQSSTFVFDVRNTSAAALGQMLINAGAQANQGRGGGAFPGGGAVNVTAPGVVQIGPNGQARGPNGQVINNNAGRGNLQQQQLGGQNRAGGVNNANRAGGNNANRAGAQAQNITGSAPTGGAITVDDAGNRILFTGTASQFAQLRGLLQRLDAPAREVLVEVTVAEVTLTDETRAGLEFFFNGSFNGHPLSGGTGSFPAPTAPVPGGGNGLAGTGLGLGTSGATLNFNNGDLRAAFNAFASNNKVNVLSRPHITAKSGSEAQIQVGDEVPIITSQRAANTANNGTTDTLQTVQYRQTGIILTITPVVYGDDRVDLTITQQVSDARANPNTAIGSPIIGSRTVSTTLTLADGRSAILGGLMEDSFSKGNIGVPFLKDIPILGQAFRTDTISGRKTELVVLITPLIIRDADDMSNLAGQLTAEMNRAFEIGRGGSYTLTPYPLGASIGIYPPKANVIGGGAFQRPQPRPDEAPTVPADAMPAAASTTAPAPKPRRRVR